MNSEKFILANVSFDSGKTRVEEMEISELSKLGEGVTVGHPCPFPARSCSSPLLSEQLFLMASCVLISMDDHHALLINTRPVND